MSRATVTAQQQTHQVCTKPAGANATSWNSHTIMVFRIVKSIDKIKKARRIQSSLFGGDIDPWVMILHHPPAICFENDLVSGAAIR